MFAGNGFLTSTLDPLSLRHKVASLSLFYRYYFGHCSDELATCIPLPMAQPRSTRQASLANNCVELSNARINRFSDGFFPSTSRLWNSLPSSVFPASFNFPSFKRQVYPHLRDQMAFFFTHFWYFINLFYSFHCFLFLFLKDADSRKGTLCPFCVPIHKKKNRVKRGSDDITSSFVATTSSTTPVPFIMPDYGRKWDEVHWIWASFSLEVTTPQPPILRWEERGLSKRGTTVDSYDWWCHRERTQKMSTKELPETNSGSLYMVLQVPNRCQLLPTAI